RPPCGACEGRPPGAWPARRWRRAGRARPRARRRQWAHRRRACPGWRLPRPLGAAGPRLPTRGQVRPRRPAPAAAARGGDKLLRQRRRARAPAGAGAVRLPGARLRRREGCALGAGAAGARAQKLLALRSRGVTTVTRPRPARRLAPPTAGPTCRGPRPCGRRSRAAWRRRCSESRTTARRARARPRAPRGALWPCQARVRGRIAPPMARPACRGLWPWRWRPAWPQRWSGWRTTARRTAR
ncbi:unnamed protein product, partial [Prorocentrum cordatum]